jgi:ubiquinone/menaquinone biosynthesis C-methylase UbiE
MTIKEKIQHQAWSEGKAADDWFMRNRVKLEANPQHSPAINLFASYIRAGEKVLEIGTSNGHQLQKLRKLTHCVGFGIDPSPAAIADGKANFPEINLAVGTADKLDFPDENFNAVIFGFCLYLVDRSLLMRAVAEADRVLMGGGKLMITDFDPAMSHRRAFAHQEGLWSYKMQYPDLWLANPSYVLAEKISFSHEGKVFHADPNERVASWVLSKQNDEAYLDLP